MWLVAASAPYSVASVFSSIAWSFYLVSINSTAVAYVICVSRVPSYNVLVARHLIHRQLMRLLAASCPSCMLGISREKEPALNPLPRAAEQGGGVGGVHAHVDAAHGVHAIYETPPLSFAKMCLRFPTETGWSSVIAMYAPYTQKNGIAAFDPDTLLLDDTKNEESELT